MREEKNVLLVANSRTMLSGMKYLIEQMKKIPYIKIFLLCDNCYYETEDIRVINIKEKISEESHLGEDTQVTTDFFNTDRKKIRKQLWQFFSNCKQMRIWNIKAKKIISDIKPDIIIIGCDRMLDISQAVLKNKKNIPCVKIPIAIQFNYDNDFGTRFYNYELVIKNKGFDINRIALLINKNWMKENYGEKRLFYPLGITLAGWINDMIPIYPWVSGANKADYVFAVDSREKERIIAENPKKKNIINTGLLEDYGIINSQLKSKEIRKYLQKKYCIEGKIVIFSLPQLAEHNLVGWNIHKKNVYDITKYINKHFGKCLISLHPKSRIEDYTFLQEKLDVEFIDEKLREVIAGADIYLADENSSTLRWGRMLKLQTVELKHLMMLKRIDREKIEELFVSDKYLDEQFEVKNIVEELKKIMQNI